MRKKFLNIRTEAQAEEILTVDPKNPFKLWIKHLCLKTETGTQFYYYMHKISLMYGQLTRFLLLMFLIIAGLTKLGFIIASQPLFIATIVAIATRIWTVLVAILFTCALLAVAVFLMTIALAITYIILLCIEQIVVHIVAALFF